MERSHSVMWNRGLSESYLPMVSQCLLERSCCLERSFVLLCRSRLPARCSHRMARSERLPTRCKLELLIAM